MPRLFVLALAASTLVASPAFAQTSGQSNDNGGSQASSQGDDTPSTLPEARAVTMNAPDGSNRGQVSMMPTPHGILLEAEINGVGEGIHGFHIHEAGVCEDDFSSAGGHYAPNGNAHGFLADDGYHAGDMPNFTAGADGSARFTVFNDQVRMREGDASLDDADGSALIIHAQPDDYISQPAGNAGDRVACGVIYPGD